MRKRSGVEGLKKEKIGCHPKSGRVNQLQTCKHVEVYIYVIPGYIYLKS